MVESADAEPPGGAAAGKLRKPRRGPRGPQGAARLFPVIPCQSACCSLPSGRTGRPSCRLAPTPGLRPAGPGRSFSSRQPRLRRPPSTLSGAVASRLTVSVAKMGCSCTSVPGYCACPWQGARLSRGLFAVFLLLSRYPQGRLACDRSPPTPRAHASRLPDSTETTGSTELYVYNVVFLYVLMINFNL